MSCNEGLAEAAVNVTEQLAVAPVPESTQVVELKTSLPTAEPKVMVPAGVNAVPLASSSVTVSVTVVDWFTTTGLVEKVRTLVVCRVLTVRGVGALVLAVWTSEPG